MTVDLAGVLRTLLTLWFTVALTLWVLVAVAAGWLAEEKGRSAVIWFLVGLVSGPFAVLLVGFAPRGASGQYRRCRECRESLRENRLDLPLRLEMLSGVTVMGQVAECRELVDRLRVHGILSRLAGPFGQATDRGAG